MTVTNESVECFTFRSGQIAGDCQAGYYCKSGSRDDIPTVTTDFSTCVANDECAGECPVGHYCPQGIELPVDCPEHTYRNTVGAAQDVDCLPCPAGEYCPQGKILVSFDITYCFNAKNKSGN